MAGQNYIQDTIIKTSTSLSYHEQKFHLAGAKQMRNEKVIQDEVCVPPSWTDKYAESLFQGCCLFSNKREVNQKQFGHTHATSLPRIPFKSDVTLLMQNLKGNISL